MQTSATKGLLQMVTRPAHGPRVDVIQLAARAWSPSLVTLYILKEVILAISHCSRDGAVVSARDERQPPQNGGGGHDVDDRIRFGLIQLLRPALISLPPPRGGIPVDHLHMSCHRLKKSSHNFLLRVKKFAMSKPCKLTQKFTQSCPPMLPSTVLYLKNFIAYFRVNR